MAGHVRQSLPDRRQQVRGDRFGHQRVDGTVEDDPWFEPQHRGRFLHQRSHPVANAVTAVGGRRQPEDGRTDVLDRDVEIVNGLFDPFHHPDVVANQPGRALERQPGREQPLDDGVVEIAGDALTVVDQRQRLHRHVQPGVVDGHRRGAGQPDGEFLVELTELGGVDRAACS